MAFITDYTKIEIPKKTERDLSDALDSMFASHDYRDFRTLSERLPITNAVDLVRLLSLLSNMQGFLFVVIDDCVDDLNDDDMKTIYYHHAMDKISNHDALLADILLFGIPSDQQFYNKAAVRMRSASSLPTLYVCNLPA